MAETVTVAPPTDAEGRLDFDGLIPGAISDLDAASVLTEVERMLHDRSGAQEISPKKEAGEGGSGRSDVPLVVYDAPFLHQVELEVSHRLQQLPWWQKPFAEQIKPFLRAKAKEELRIQAAGVLSTSSFATEAARIVGDESRQDEVASSCERVAQSKFQEIPALPEASGKAAIAKAVLHEYVKKGSGATSLAAAGLMFVPGGQLIGSAAIAVHSAIKIKTSVHDAGKRAQEHVAQAQIRLQAIGSAGEDMGALARIKHNLSHAHQLPASTIKEFGVKALAYAGAVLSPLGEEHQIARAGAKGFSRMVSADELLAAQDDILASAGVTELVSLSERIGQSLARGYVRNMQRADELKDYRARLDARAEQRSGHAYEVLAARNKQGEVIAAELDELARTDAKWAARHELGHKLAYGALSSVAAVRMVVEATAVAQGIAAISGADMHGVPVVHAAASHLTSVNTAQADLHQHIPTQPNIPEVPAKDAPLVDKGILPGHGQGFAVDTTPDGKSVRFYSLDNSGNAIEFQSGGQTYIIPFNHGQLVLGHDGTVNAVTNDGSIVQLKQDDVLKYLGIDQHVQNGLQQHGGVLELSGYQIRRVTEVQYDAQTGAYHELASTAGQQGGTFEAHTDTLPVQHTDQGGGTTTPGGGTSNQPTPTPTPKPQPSPTPTQTPSPTPTPTQAPAPSPTAIPAPSPTTVPNVVHTPDQGTESIPVWARDIGSFVVWAGLLGGIGYVSYDYIRHQRSRNQPQAVVQPLTPLPTPQLPTPTSALAPPMPVARFTPPVPFASAPSVRPTVELVSPEGVAEIVQLGIPETFSMRHAQVETSPGQKESIVVKVAEYRPEVLDEAETPYYAIGWASDEGDKRRGKPDEDTIKVITVRGITLAIVADGMGGLAAGKAASELIANKIAEVFERAVQAEADESKLTKQWAANALASATKVANEALYNDNQAEHRDSGSTVTVAAVLEDGSYAVANVGDARTYHVGSTAAARITKDHSVVESLAAAGIIQRDAVYTYPKRNQVWGSTGEKLDITVDTFMSADGEELTEGQELVLCCDGIWEMVREPDGSVTNARKFHSIVQSTASPMEAARRLVIAAIYGDGKTYGGDDNASALVIRRKPAAVAA